MLYLIERNGHQYFNRRVPARYSHLDKRRLIRERLNTRDKKIALSRAMAKNEKLEAYWETLLHTGQQHSPEQYTALVERASLLGFPYLPSAHLAQLPIAQILERLMHIEKENFNEAHVEAVAGKISQPVMRLGEVLESFFELAKDKVLNKSAVQIRKWQVPRKKALRNFIKCVGDKALHEITREDALKFRDWWIDRVKNEGLSIDSANKELIQIKTIVSTVAENYKISLDSQHVFKKLLLKGESLEVRLPLDNAFIVSTLLNKEKLDGLNEEAQSVILAISETGAGIKELTGLLPEDIRLDADIPHIIIRPRKEQSLKTKFRTRTIPLVGFALDAFKAFPNGFARYRERPDSLSTHLNKFLRQNNLLPSPQHSVYSLRHSFQDRLLAVNTPDRIQADLMGHKFARPRYGEGATLAHKLEWMQKVQLKGNY